MRKILILITIVFLLAAFTSSAEANKGDSSGKFKLNQGYFLNFNVYVIDENGLIVNEAILQLTNGNGKIIDQVVVRDGDSFVLEDNGISLVGEIDRTFSGMLFYAIKFNEFNLYDNGENIFSSSDFTIALKIKNS